ncbi:MAG: 2Fe-2S iron-sulfur cluster-binding protein [Planctomycetota bacterium]|nr:2Fe-2S iron-sulfur cluster-binding protein [Planctomycetota bacterium]
MSRRLPPQPGEWIQRDKAVEFRFEGREYTGFQGDVLSSALWANGINVLGRSFKYHRPRGIYSLAGHDANVVVEDRLRSNLRGDVLPIRGGMDLRAVNTGGGLAGDRYRIMEWLSPFLPVGFYYKAFHTPRRFFRFYEGLMRRAAGLGRIHVGARADMSRKDYAFCDLLVVGAGPSGLSAAIAAAEMGATVLLVDDQPRPGGSLCWQHLDAPESRSDLLEKACALPNLEIRSNTQAAGWYADQWVALVDDRRLTKLRTRATLVASGCIEQPAVFHNNDLPGVMLASAAQRLMKLYSVKPCDRAVVLTANDDGYLAALDLADAGVVVAAVVDLRPAQSCTPVAAEVAAHGIEILKGQAVYEAVVSRSKNGIAAAVVCCLDQNGQPRLSSARRILCDGIAVSVGWAPNASILAQAGTRFRYDSQLQQLAPHDLPRGVFAAGRVNGIFALEERIADGRQAGLAAVAFLGHQIEVPASVPRSRTAHSHAYPIFDHPHKKNFVDLDEDLQLVDLLNAHQEGYDSIELIKRYSTVGMGPSQGKLSNMNAVRVVARLNGQSLDQTGMTTARPFYQPVSIANLAGRRFHPYRLTPMDGWHRQAGAVMVPVGTWFRPEYYATKEKSRADCVLEEAREVRRGVGLIDISTLCKFEVAGPDAARFLEQIYTGRFARQNIGRMRYALACDEMGYVTEEGVVARLAEDRFYVTASTAGGEAFYREMQRWAIVFHMNVVLSNVTAHMAAINVAGPRARGVLAEIAEVDIGATEFPFAHVRDMVVAGVAAIVMRVGFVGELSYEIHVPADKAAGVWDALILAGRNSGIRPFGTEAQRLLRLEKGHLIAGHDTDPLTTPFEAQLDWAVDMNKSFFIGQRSLRIHAGRPLERRLVGIAFAYGYLGELPEECRLIVNRGQIAGRVTSIAGRTTVGGPIGLAFVRPDLAEPGTSLCIRVDAREMSEAQVVRLPFYDPDNTRQT